MENNNVQDVRFDKQEIKFDKIARTLQSLIQVRILGHMEGPWTAIDFWERLITDKAQRYFSLYPELLTDERIEDLSIGIKTEEDYIPELKELQDVLSKYANYLKKRRNDDL